MGHHGWRGDPPPTEELARDRIIEGATRCLERRGVDRTTLSDVAEEVGVTRQTVYRYFSGLTELLAAVAQTGAAEFVVRTRAHLATCTTPVEVVAEATVFALQEIPGDLRMSLLLEADERDLFGRGVTSSDNLALGAHVLRDAPVTWSDHGVRTDADFEELAELLMRLWVSFLQHPPATPRTSDQVRALVRRWLGPALGTD